MPFFHGQSGVEPYGWWFTEAEADEPGGEVVGEERERGVVAAEHVDVLIDETAEGQRQAIGTTARGPRRNGLRLKPRPHQPGNDCEVAARQLRQQVCDLLEWRPEGRLKEEPWQASVGPGEGKRLLRELRQKLPPVGGIWLHPFPGIQGFLARGGEEASKEISLRAAMVVEGRRVMPAAATMSRVPVAS